MIRTFLALLLLAAPAAAQTTNRALCEPSVIEIQADLLPDEAWAEIDTRAAEMPNGTGRLWRVTSPEGAVSHLWGTMHSADPRISNPPQILRDLIADADTVMLEYIASHISQRDAEGQLGPQNYTQAAPHNLLEKLPQEAAIGLSARLTQYGHTEEEIPYLSPGYLFYTALSHPCGDRYAMAGFPIQDTRIEMLAADAGHRLEPLDPPDMLYTFSTTKKWARPFEDTLALFSLWQLEQKSTATFYELYRTGQVGRMMAFERAYLTRLFPNIDIPAISDNADRFLLEHRNREMVVRALPHLREGNVVMAAGTYHLPLSFGLVSLLRNRGFEVERIVVPGEIE